jgi:prepilin-type N-terminal cleavage/methylation domain-containing protein
MEGTFLGPAAITSAMGSPVSHSRKKSRKKELRPCAASVIFVSAMNEAKSDYSQKRGGTVQIRYHLKSLCQAFTRVELLAVLAVLGLLAAVALPALASNRARFERIVCVNNLRLIGRAFHIWGADHGGENPWWVSTYAGGTQYQGKVGFCFDEFRCVSNHLETPRILVCPSDPARRMATNWSNDPNGGLGWLGYQDRAVSYFIGIHASALLPRSILSGDRFFRNNGAGHSCSVGFIEFWTVQRYPTVLAVCRA